MAIIDNKNITMQETLRAALKTADSIDISVAFFYFNGLELLTNELLDKKIRLMVGMEIQPDLIPFIVKESKDKPVDISKYQVRPSLSSSLAKKNNFEEVLIGLINDSDIFDESSIADVLDLFLKKIENGTFEIRKNDSFDHSKFYIAHDKELNSERKQTGTVIMGSANFTYKGLVGQGETNEKFTSIEKYEEYKAKFEEEWKNAVIIVDEYSNKSFVKTIKDKTWPYNLVTPYQMYIKVLDEVFGKDEETRIHTPAQLTFNQYIDLEYQLDAIRMGIDRINKYDGVIIADVVGLGKSIIASAIARNFDDYLTVIVAPPHIIGQWEDYQKEFGLRAAKVYSSGKIKELHEHFTKLDRKIMLIIDEAHRFRNEDTDDYKLLHQVTRSHPDNKVMLLTATPFNNEPKDIFSLIKLFQIPGRSTIRSVDNLSFRFRNLIDKYTWLRREIRKNNIDDVDYQNELSEIAYEQRRLIENVVIRRSRLDLKNIDRYKEDLQAQNIDFPEVIGPKLIEYDLEQLNDLYIETLNLLVEKYTAARYQPTHYGIDSEKFKEMLGEEIDERGLRIGQLNLANHMKRLLVMRFESSKMAFKNTLEKMIDTNKTIETWWHSQGGVPIMKKGVIPNPDDYLEEDGENISNEFEEDIEKLKETKGLFILPKDLFIDFEAFENDLMSDTKLLTEIYNKWFENDELLDIDSKLDKLEQKIQELLEENPKRKIVVFSTYADTVNYLYDSLKEKMRVAKYTSKDPNYMRQEIRKNFDAALPAKVQLDDYDVVFTTDALSEGINLHRAGIVINYDIPYNPTRVIQRVGRINRINRKVFDEIFLFNFFPTMIGEAETRIKQISTLKITLINKIIGSDTRHLTPDENLESIFKNEFEKASDDIEDLSWDTVHLDTYYKVLKNEKLMNEARNIPRRSRIKRKQSDFYGTIAFGKKGKDSVFAITNSENEAKIVSVEEAMPYFVASRNEEPFEVSQNFDGLLTVVRDKLFAKHSVPPIKGRRQKAIELLNAVKSVKPETLNYCNDLIKIIKEYDDLSDGTLKDLININLNDTENIYENLQNIVSENLIRNILQKADKTEEGQELLLLMEEHVNEIK